MLLLLALASPTLAAPPTGWYTTDQVAQDSALFQRSADQLGPRYQAIEDELRRISPAVEDLDLATTLARDSIGQSPRKYAMDIRTQAAALLAAAQRHVDTIQDAYQANFGAALDRALAQLADQYSIDECTGGSSIQSMMGHTPRCQGEDLNAVLAASLDADPALATAIDQINALPWPAPTLSGVSQPVLALTGDAGFIQLAPVARALWASHLEDRSDDLDRKVAPLDDALKTGDADALKQAKAARQAYEDTMAADGQVLISQLQASLDRTRKKGGADIGLCLNPQALMGCPGTDRTAELLPLLQADRKLSRALSALP